MDSPIRTVLAHILLATAFLTSSAGAAYECPKPKESYQKKTRCRYIDETLAAHERWYERQMIIKKEAPHAGKYTIPKILKFMEPMARSCLYAPMSQPAGRLRNCSTTEIKATGCTGASRKILNVVQLYTNIANYCQQFNDIDARKHCFAKREKKISSRKKVIVKQAAKELGKIITKRTYDLSVERPDVCNTVCEGGLKTGADKQCYIAGKECSRCLPNTTPMHFWVTLPSEVNFNNSNSDNTRINAGQHILTQSSAGDYGGGDSCKYVTSGSNTLLELDIKGGVALNARYGYLNWHSTNGLLPIITYWTANSPEGQVDCTKALELALVPQPNSHGPDKVKTNIGQQ